uniref:HP domain-containing protein n=1 Tax=Arcella intermedia TaxID=1963864 RepID=A0A6B2KY72_9EUKA
MQTLRDGGPWEIFFWLGAESSQDEKGTAALKTVTLDDLLGGTSTQHREIQYHESEQFLALFKGGIEYTSEGAVDSAFVKVDRSAFKTRLLHLKGTRNVRVKPVHVSYTSLNSGDVFILETATVIWQWNGSESSRREKLTGLQTTTRLRDSRGAKIYVEVIEEGTEPEAFWTAIGGKGKIKSSDEGGSDETFEKLATKATKLYHVSDASGQLEVTFIGSPPLKQSQLNSDDCHILDIGTELFVWVGKGCTKQEKTQSMTHAESFLKNDTSRPEWVPITRVVEGAETTIFKAQFVQWKDSGINQESQNTWGNNPSDFDAYQEQQRKLREENAKRKIDMASLITSKSSKKEDFTTDGEGTIQIWRIENFEAVPVPADTYGVFFGGDSYLILYTPDSKKQPPLLYYWLGKKSTKDEQGAAVLLSKEIAEKHMGDGIKATLVRVTQGKEPGHFLNIFKGKFVVRFGGIESGFQNVQEEEDERDSKEGQLFHIHGTSTLDTKAIQVPLKAASLNSADSFVLVTEKVQYVWYGKGCEDVEREFADKAATFLHKEQEIVKVEEENEPEEFWKVLGGKGPYQNSPELQAEVREARLFHCSNASGKFEIEEIHHFDQDDLLMDDVFLLDVYSSVMVWVGPESNEEEKLKSFEMALDYVRQASQIDGRDPECSVIRILAGAEPPMFTRWFHGWDDTRGESDAYRLALEALKTEGPSVMDVKTALEEYKKAETLRFSYKEVARTPNNPLPNGGKGIDRANLERYLNDEDFQKLFKMSKEAWEKVPKWKKNNLKKEYLLF